MHNVVHAVAFSYLSSMYVQYVLTFICFSNISTIETFTDVTVYMLMKSLRSILVSKGGALEPYASKEAPSNNVVFINS